MKALAWSLTWLECHPAHLKVAGLIPGQGAHLGVGSVPGRVHMGGNQSLLLSYIDVALSLSPTPLHLCLSCLFLLPSLPRSFPLSLKSMNTSLGEDLKQKKR